MPTLDAVHWGPASKVTPKQLVILCHGLGADAFDVIDLAPAWQHACPDALFASVHAPFSHDSGFGRQWWSVADRSPPVMEAGARAAAAYLHGFIDAELAAQGLGPADLVLLGFSQGAMMALHIGLRRAVPPRLVLSFSGLLAGKAPVPPPGGAYPPVFLSHGDSDTVIPPQLMFVALGALQQVGATVEWHLASNTAHGIDPGSLDLGARFLEGVLAPKT